jgi:hypothetical protein
MVARDGIEPSIRGFSGDAKDDPAEAGDGESKV